MSGKLQPLPKEVTDEIRYILEGCRNGRLKHEQEAWHCRTAHCIGGWKEILDLKKADKSYELGYDTPGDYAQAKWQLTYFEKNLLFDGAAKYWHQFALLEQLEKGVRFDDGWGDWADYLLDISPERAKPEFEGKIPLTLVALVDAIIDYQHPKPNPIVEELLNPKKQAEEFVWNSVDARQSEDYSNTVMEILVGSTRQRH